MNTFVITWLQLTFTQQTTPFYCQILDNWDEFPSINTKKNRNEILNEKVWFNKDILIDYKPIFYRIWCNHGITKIYDLFNNQGIFKTKEELSNDYHLHVTKMELNCIKSAIPKEWVKQIKLQPTEKYSPLSDFIVKIKNTNKPVTKITCKEFNYELTSKNVQRWKALETWEELCFNKFWLKSHTYNLIFICKWNIFAKPSPKLSITTFPVEQLSVSGMKMRGKKVNFVMNDTIEHYFFECKMLTMFWKTFVTWWNEKSLCTFNLGQLDIVFGIFNENNDCILSALNYCILYAKKFIQNCKLNNQPLLMNNFICKLKQRLIIEEYIAEVNNTLENFRIKWDFLYSN